MTAQSKSNEVTSQEHKKAKHAPFHSLEHSVRDKHIRR